VKRADTPLTLFTVCLAYFLSQLGFSPVTVVLPTVAAGFGVDQSQAAWVLSGYLLTMTGCLLVAGKLGDRYGHKYLLTAGLAVYALGAGLAALAPSIWALVGSRAIQGLGTAFIAGNSLAIVAGAFKARGGRAIGLLTMSSFVGSAFGTITGDLALQYFTWRFVFLTMVPLALLAFALSARLPDLGLQPARRAKLDVLGAALLFLALVAFSLSLTHLHDGPETFAAGWEYHSSMQALAILLFALFVAAERRTRDPVFDFRFFRNGLFTSTQAANGVLHFGMMGTFFLMPFVMQGGLGLGPNAIAGVMLSLQVSSTLWAYLVGWLYDRTRAWWIRPAALVVILSGILTLALFATQLPFFGFLLVAAWMGVGLGGFSTVNNAVAVGSLGAEHRGVASGMLETTRQFGHTVALSVSTTAMTIAAGPLVIGQSRPAEVLAGFQAAAMTVGLVALVGIPIAAVSRSGQVSALLSTTPLLRRLTPAPPAGGAR